MNQFQKRVLSIAIGVLLFTLFIIAILIRKSSKKLDFPPETAKCPDYWTLNSDQKCMNTKGLGSCTGDMDFNTDEYSGKRGKDEKCNWAKGCGVEWDGITNIGIC